MLVKLFRFAHPPFRMDEELCFAGVEPTVVFYVVFTYFYSFTRDSNPCLQFFVYFPLFKLWTNRLSHESTFHIDFFSVTTPKFVLPVLLRCTLPYGYLQGKNFVGFLRFERGTPV